MNVNGWNEVIGPLFIFVGTIFSFISAIGLIRLPDVYTRAHSSSKSTTLGVLCILFGTFLFFLMTDEYISVRLLLGIFFIFLTSPISAHMVLRSAYRTNVKMYDKSVQDDLKDVLRDDVEDGKTRELENGI